MDRITIPRRQFLAATAAAAGTSLVGLPAWAKAAYPSKPVRFIVPFNPGGATDIVARVLAEAVSKKLGQPVIVENKAGASAMLGTDMVAKSAPDGYNVVVSLSTSLLINQFLYTKMAYNPQKDLLMLSLLASAPVTLVVHPSVPANNMKELLAWVKAHKGKVSYGSWGVGSYAHLGGAYMSKSMDADMTHVAYKGEAPMIQELIGGQLQLCFSSAQNTKPFIDSGRLKAIGVTGKSRMSVLPQLPTIYEQGVTDDAYAIAGFVGMALPAGTPKDVVDVLSAAIQDAAQDPKVKERIDGAGFLPVFSSPEGFAKTYAQAVPVWKSLIEVADARVD
ncbi:tripartite tricarboxylate transporter substrate binding protein [Comamonas aquatica]|uniref:Bug family tripartite tricarboxylate transporter substrate binding protein n=1 Tax=Comamonas aquatica TaxID=225991 RepID=UPI00244BD718|nr:tripartite tricarboxylate transporter substrate binding protein [Comamonas aquatica]MDH0201819.1 tripartite tricarboxylate transporter substrate binding protein [Comamonas aquatica]MDH1445489.1 tripartite tricarboxylate transporter substrate binding protein [Comamonas aquatica]